jgi:hypothetical protein
MLCFLLLPMASLFKHPKSQYWTACFRDENGIQRRISTKETNRKKALKIASAYEAASREKRTLRQTQHVIDQLHHELTGHRVSRTSLRNFVDTWLAVKKPETAARTHVFYSEAAAPCALKAACCSTSLALPIKRSIVVRSPVI